MRGCREHTHFAPGTRNHYQRQENFSSWILIRNQPFAFTSSFSSTTKTLLSLEMQPVLSDFTFFPPLSLSLSVSNISSRAVFN